MHWDDRNLHKLAGYFFRKFSRIEYALKASGYLVANRRNAEADWTMFALDIHDSFEQLDDTKLIEAINFILTTPPRKQINDNGNLTWEDISPDSRNQTDLLLQYVRRVRNNLFHGGKFNGEWFEPDRSGPLIEAGMEILTACLNLSEDLNRAYES